MTPRSLYLLLALALALNPRSGNAQRAIDLTGKPEATLQEPFTRITGLRELSGGLVIVTDPADKVIVVGDFATGKRRSIGRVGDGPNEFRFPATAIAGVGDTTWVPDPMLNRIHLVTSAGIVGSVPVPSTLTGFTSIRGSDRLGRLYVEGSSYDPDSGGFSDSVPILRWVPKTTTTERLGRTWSGGRVILGEGTNRMSLARSITPYPHLDAWVALPDGRAALVRHAPYRIDIVAGPGRVIAGPTITQPAIPITARERTAFRESQVGTQMSATARGGGGGQMMPGTDFKDADFPGTLPPFIHDAVFAIPEGEIWIGRSAPVGSATVKYDIHDGTGKLIGNATLKANYKVVGFGRGVVYVTRSTDDGLLYLEKYRR